MLKRSYDRTYLIEHVPMEMGTMTHIDSIRLTALAGPRRQPVGLFDVREGERGDGPCELDGLGHELRLL
jgi:hypothetical protein